MNFFLGYHKKTEMELRALIEVPDSLTLVEVHPELWSKGWVYVAEDCRRQLLLVAQRLGCLSEAIERLTNETPSIASLSESATLRLRKGRTGNWLVRRVPREEAAVYLETRRHLFQRTVIAAINPGAWKLCDHVDEKKLESNCNIEVSICDQPECLK